MDPHQIYREDALRHLCAPEQLDEQLEVTPRRVWLVFAAIVALLTGITAWSWFARIPVTLRVEGAYVSARELTVFVPVADSRRVQAGMTALVQTAAGSTQPGIVRNVALQPASRAELLAVLMDESAPVRGARVPVTIELPGGDEVRGTPVRARIVVAEQRPLALLAGR